MDTEPPGAGGRTLRPCDPRSPAPRTALDRAGGPPAGHVHGRGPPGHARDQSGEHPLPVRLPRHEHPPGHRHRRLLHHRLPLRGGGPGTAGLRSRPLPPRRRPDAGRLTPRRRARACWRPRPATRSRCWRSRGCCAASPTHRRRDSPLPAGATLERALMAPVEQLPAADPHRAARRRRRRARAARGARRRARARGRRRLGARRRRALAAHRPRRRRRDVPPPAAALGGLPRGQRPGAPRRARRARRRLAARQRALDVARGGRGARPRRGGRRRAGRARRRRPRPRRARRRRPRVPPRRRAVAVATPTATAAGCARRTSSSSSARSTTRSRLLDLARDEAPPEGSRSNLEVLQGRLALRRNNPQAARRALIAVAERHRPSATRCARPRSSSRRRWRG